MSPHRSCTKLLPKRTTPSCRQAVEHHRKGTREPITFSSQIFCPCYQPRFTHSHKTCSSQTVLIQGCPSHRYPRTPQPLGQGTLQTVLATDASFPACANPTMSLPSPWCSARGAVPVLQLQTGLRVVSGRGSVPLCLAFLAQIFIFSHRCLILKPFLPFLPF